jgi:citrate synthase
MIDISGQSFLEVHEAAELLGVKPETLYAYVSRGRLRSYRQGVGRRRLYLKAEVEALLDLQPPAPSAALDAATPAPQPGAKPAESYPRADAWAAER